MSQGFASGIILAGGKSRRLGGDKASLFLDRVVCAIRPHVAEVLVAGRDRVLSPAARPVPDLFPDHGPMSGIYSGMLAASFDRCLVAACDMPFIQPALVERLIGLIGEDDALVPRIEGRPQPLLAVYRKTCLSELREALEQNHLKVDRLLDRVRTRYVTEGDLREADPELISFFNVNRPEDLDRARALGL